MRRNMALQRAMHALHAVGIEPMLFRATLRKYIRKQLGRGKRVDIGLLKASSEPFVEVRSHSYTGEAQSDEMGRIVIIIRIWREWVDRGESRRNGC